LVVFVGPEAPQKQPNTLKVWLKCVSPVTNGYKNCYKKVQKVKIAGAKDECLKIDLRN
jgi:hypothetical protein